LLLLFHPLLFPPPLVVVGISLLGGTFLCLALRIDECAFSSVQFRFRIWLWGRKFTPIEIWFGKYFVEATKMHFDGYLAFKSHLR